MEMILPPIHGTTLRDQSPLFISTGVLDSSVPLCPETFSTSGIRLALSASKQENVNARESKRMGIQKKKDKTL